MFIIYNSICLFGKSVLNKISISREFSEIIRKKYTILYSFHMNNQFTDLLFNVFTFKVDRLIIKDYSLMKVM